MSLLLLRDLESLAVILVLFLLWFMLLAVGRSRRDGRDIDQ